MRYGHPSVTPARVHALAQQLLARHLGWTDTGKAVRASQLLDLVLWIAASGRSLFDLARQWCAASHQTVRQALYGQLADEARLTAALVDTLYDVQALSRNDRRRQWVVAIDTHDVPFYGKRSTPGVVGGPKKEGTKYFYRYATAILVHDRRRYTVGFAPLTDSQKPHDTVATLLDQIDGHRLRIRGVVLDSGFDSGDTLLLLQRRGLDYTVPLRRKGTGSNHRNDWFAAPVGTVRSVTWTTERTRQSVSTDVFVYRAPGSPDVKVFAFAGWGSRTACTAYRRAWKGYRRYRQRFGIETSYRQKNQAKGATTSTNPRYRLLLEGVAHLLRQLWVRLTEEIARDGGLPLRAWVKDLTLAMMLEELMAALRQRWDDPMPDPTDLNDFTPANAF